MQWLVHCLIVLYLSFCIGCYGLEKCLKEFDLIDIEAGSKLYSLGLRFTYALHVQYLPVHLFLKKFLQALQPWAQATFIVPVLLFLHIFSDSIAADSGFQRIVCTIRHGILIPHMCHNLVILFDVSKHCSTYSLSTRLTRALYTMSWHSCSSLAKRQSRDNSYVIKIPKKPSLQFVSIWFILSYRYFSDDLSCLYITKALWN